MKYLITPSVMFRWGLTLFLLLCIYITGSLMGLLLIALIASFFCEFHWYCWREAIENKRDIIFIWGEKIRDWGK